MAAPFGAVLNLFKRGRKIADGFFERIGDLWCQFFFVRDGREQVRMPQPHRLLQRKLEAPHIFDREAVQEALCAGEKRNDLFLDRQWLILPLFKELDETLAAAQQLLCRLVKIASEFCECLELAVLR